MTEHLNINQLKAYLGILSFLKSPNIGKVPEKVIGDKKAKLTTYRTNPAVQFIESDWFRWYVQWNREKRWIAEGKEEFTPEWFDHMYKPEMTDDEIIEEYNTLIQIEK